VIDHRPSIIASSPSRDRRFPRPDFTQSYAERTAEIRREYRKPRGTRPDFTQSYAERTAEIRREYRKPRGTRPDFTQSYAERTAEIRREYEKPKGTRPDFTQSYAERTAEIRREYRKPKDQEHGDNIRISVHLFPASLYGPLCETHMDLPSVLLCVTLRSSLRISA
jgi:hypothetical protein